MTFNHSGDLGDVIYSLPAIRALGGGHLYLDSTGGLADPLVKWADRKSTKLNERSIEFIAPLINRLAYVKLTADSSSIDLNLNEFRRHHKYHNLADAHLAIEGLPFSERDRAWIEPLKPKRLARYVINRTPRYQSNFGWWEDLIPRIQDCCVFIGYKKEHEYFEYAFRKEGQIPFYQVEGIEDMVNVIAGSECFMGNEGFCNALAQSIRHNLICEVNQVYPAVIFKRSNARYV